MSGKVLTVAESDSCGAAGLQADTKTILALGGYAMTAVSAVTSQNTNGIAHLHTLEPWFVEQQMRVVLEDIGANAIKTGILVNSEIVNAVGDVLDSYRDHGIAVVVDPSIIARRGEQLMDETAIATLKRRLFIRSTVLTPNKREAELLTGMAIRDIDDMRHAASMMRTLGAETVLLKAGEAASGKAVYLLATESDERIYERPMIATKRTLGAGATLASAIAVSLSQKMDIITAVERGLDYMHHAMLYARDYDTEAGPMNHAFAIEKNAEALAKDMPRTGKVKGSPT